MTQLGQGTQPGFSYFAYDSASNPNQVVEKLTAPTRLRILTVGAWLGGWNQNSQVVIGIWAADGTLLGRTAEFTVANEGDAGDLQTSLYTEDLQTPVIIDNGEDFYVGANRDRADDGIIWNTGSNAYLHYRARAPYPDGDLGEVEAATSFSRRIGAYVVDYEPVGVIRVRRSSAWVEADAVKVYRSGAWEQVNGVKVLRSGVWVDAE